MTENSLLKIGEAAKFLKVSIDTLRRWEKAGKITTIRTPGGTRLYPLSVLEKLKYGAGEGTYSVSQAAQHLGVSVKTLRRWDKEGKLPVERNNKGERVYLVEHLDKNLASQGQALQGSQPQPVSNTTSDSQLHPLWGSEELNPENSERLRKPDQSENQINQQLRSSDSLTIRSSGPLRKTSTPSHSESFRKLAFLAPLTFTVLFLFISTLVFAGYSYLPSSFPSSFPIPSFLSSVISGRDSIGRSPDLQNDNNNGTVKPASRSERSKQFNNSPAVLAAETVKQILEINADTNIYGLLTSEGLTINGAGSFTSLTASSSATFSGPATFEGSLTSTGGLTSTGNNSLSNLTLTGPLTVSSGNVGIGTTSTNSYKAYISGTLYTSGASSFGSTLAVTGATTLSSTLTVSGASTLSSTLEVSGKLTAKDEVNVSGATTLSGALTTSGATTLSSTLAVTGASTFSSTGTFSGKLTSLGNVGIAGNVGIGTTSPVTLLDVNNKLNVLSGGNVGVGTTSPAFKLQVAGDLGPSLDATYNLGSASNQWKNLYLSGISAIGGQATFTSAPTGTGVGDGVVYINPPSVADNSYTLFGIAVNGTEKLRMDGSGNITVQGNLLGPSGGSVGYWTRAGTTLYPYTSGDHITTLGNVGIGTTTPAAKLNILGAGTSTALSFLTRDSAGTNRFAILDNGNVGIGTTSPNELFHLYGGHGSVVKFEASAGVSQADIDIRLVKGTATSYGTLGFYTGSTRNYFLSNYNDGTFRISRDSVHTDLILNNGNVGIGTTNPDTQLVIKGEGTGFARIGSSGYGGNYTGISLTNAMNGGAEYNILGGDGNLFLNIQNNPSGKSILFRAGNSNLMTISGDSGNVVISPGILTVSGTGNSSFAGNVGIGTTNPGNLLTVNGNVGIGTTAFVNAALSVMGGNVGIGTTSPSTLLTINGGAGLTNGLSISSIDNATRAIDLSSSGFTGLATQYYLYNSSTNFWRSDGHLVSSGNLYFGNDWLAYVNRTTLQFEGAGTIQTRYNADLTITAGGTGDVLMTTDSDTDLNVGSGQLFIKGSDGNVGIGTTNPGNLLTVNGNVGIGTTAFVNARLAVMGGNVGIGTTDPTTSGYNLAVVGTGNFTGALSANTFNKVTITSPASAATLTLADGSSLITSGAYSLTLTTTNTTNVTLPTTGTLATLAGTESFSNKTFTGDTFFPSGIWNTGGNIGIGTTTPSVGTRLAVMGGNVGIGTTSPSSLFDINSLFKIDSTGNVGISSDKKIYNLTSGSSAGGIMVEEATTNLSTNPSFETGTTDWANGNAGGANPCETFEQSTDQVKFGIYSLKCVSSGDGVTRHTLSVSASTTYTATAYVYLSSAGTVMFDEYDMTGEQQTSTSTTGQWVRLTSTFTTPVGTTSIDFRLFTLNSTTFYVDGFQLEQRSSATTFAVGSRSGGSLTADNIPALPGINLGGLATLNGGLTVTGNVTFNSGATTTFASPVTTSGTLTASGTVTTNSTLTSAGGLYLSSGTRIYNSAAGSSAGGIMVEEATTNSSTNPSFETGITDWANGNAGGANPCETFEQSTDQVKFGIYSLKCISSGDGLTRHNIAVSANTTYTASAYVYLSSAGTVTFDENGMTGQQLTSTSTTGQWVRLTSTFTTPVGTTSIDFRLFTLNSTTFYVDGFQLEQKSYATEYADGSLGVAHAWTGTAHASTSTRTAGTIIADNGLVTLGGLSSLINSSTFPALTINQQGTGNIANFQDNGSSVFLISDGGNIGIGTTTPGNLLSLTGGNVGIGTTAFVNARLSVMGGNVGIGVTNPSAPLMVIGGGTSTGFLTRFQDSAYTDRVTILDNGNVGIGTTSPWTKLHVDGDFLVDNSSGARGRISVAGGASHADYTFTYDGDTLTSYGLTGYSDSALGNPGLAVAGYQFINLFTNNLPRVTIKNDGNVGIGTTNPGNLLTVNGNVGIGTTAFVNAKLAIMGGNVGIGTTSPIAKTELWGAGTSTALSFLTRDSGGTNRFAILDNGNVGIGTTGPSAPLHIQRDQGDSGSVELRITGYGTANNTGHTQFRGFRSRGTPALPSAVTSEDILTTLTAVGYGATDFKFATDIRSVADGTFTDSSSPGYLAFLTTPSGSTSVSERVRITSAGNVGIGTTLPSTAFSVAENFKVTSAGVVTGGTYNKVTITSPASAATLTLADGSSLITSGAYSLTLTTTNTTNVTLPTTGTLATLAGTESFSNKTFTGDTFFPSGIWNTGGNIGIGTTTPSVGTRLAVMGGNVGIGTTSPGAKIDVSSTSGGANSGFRLIQAAENGTAEYSYIPVDFTVPTTGLIGQLFATANNYSNGSMNIPANSLGLFAEATAGTLTLGAGGASGDIRFNTGGYAVANERIRITASGNVGIGTTNPGGKLTVIGGNVGIGTTSPTAPLEVKGTGTGAVIAKFTDVTTTGCAIADGGTISCSSDINLKKNISSLDYGLSEVLKLRPVNYNWKSQDDSVTKNLGFIAQEVESIIPKLVSTDDTGLKQLNTIGMVPVLTKALQELDTRMMNYELRIKNLEGKVNDQEATSSASSVILEGGDSQLIGSLDSLATPSASLQNDIFVVSEATISAQLTAYSATIQEVFKSLGETFLGNTTIAGNFSIDGTLSLTGNSLSTLGTLYLQNGPLAGDIDLFNGLVKIDNTGDIDLFNGLVKIDNKGNAVAQTITTQNLITNNLTIKQSESPTIGSGKILAGQTKTTIQTQALTSTSKVFITSTTLTDKPLSVIDLKPQQSFDVAITSPLNFDLEFNWWIIEVQ